MTTFALVHGAWHDASCWQQLSPALQAAGHDVVVVDLPSDDPSASFSDYADVVVRSLEGVTDDVVLVGHSLAGHTIPLVAARRPVRRLVYLCALVAVPGRGFAEQLQEEPQMLVPGYERGLRVQADGCRVWADDALAVQTFYDDCPADLAAAAVARLRPQSPAPYLVPCPLEVLPSAPATYVVCTEDRLVDPAWSRRVARDHLHAELVELPGGHSPFLSRPTELAQTLLRLG